MIATLATLVLVKLPSIHVSVDGEGYLRFAKGAQVVYARQASLSADTGALATADGALLWPKVVIPSKTSVIRIGLDGSIQASGDYGQKLVGQIVLAMFSGNVVMTKLGNFGSTPNRPQLGNPGDGLYGVIRTDSQANRSQSTTSAQTFATPTKTPTKPIGRPNNAATLATATVAVRSFSEVEGDTIYLKDIAELDGDPALVAKLERVSLGPTPIIGANRGLSLVQVRAFVMAAGIKASQIEFSIPDGAEATRKHQVIAANVLVEAVKREADRKFGLKIPMQADKMPADAKVAVGDVSIDVDQCSQNGNNISATVSLRLAGKTLTSRTVTLIPDPSAILVKANEPIRLRMVCNGAKIEVAAKTKTQAFVGQMITVATEGGTVHSGLLISPSTVEVKL